VNPGSGNTWIRKNVKKAARTHFDQAGSIEDKSGEGLEEILPFLFFMLKQICVLLHVTILVAF
jgi:hypothetical protein